MSIGLGVTTALVARLYQKWKLAQTAYILIGYSSDNVSFHSKVLNLPMIALCSTMAIGVFVAVTNHKFASQEETVKSFTVFSVGTRSLRYEQRHIIRVTDGVYDTNYDLGLDNSSSYKVGDTVQMQVKKGLWGFSIVTLIE